MTDELRQRLHATSDAGRPQAVEKRRKTGQRTARENVTDLADPGSFVEYGGLALAAQRHAKGVEELVKESPADGIVCGLCTVNGQRAMALAYDYTVFAGTQGHVGHAKLDRMIALARQWSVPIVFFAEGGGGRPNDTDVLTVAGLDTTSFLGFASLSGKVPRVGIVSGRCFAGNAALLGCCDVIIATDGSNVGMGGPAMIAGGGLGSFAPEDIGPVAVQKKSGVIDVHVKDEAAAVATAKQYLSYFQGPQKTWKAPDQAVLATALPENRRRAYKVRPILDTLADEGSVLELRPEFGRSVVTALVRLEGHPFGVIANDCFHLGGALDSDASDKAARFIQLCDAFGLPIVSLCDTPGFMVGPAAEATGLVRHASRLFIAAGSIQVPWLTVVLRRGYGLGAQAMSGGHFHAGLFTVSWPTGEFGGMNHEGAVRLGMKKQLAAIEDEQAREALVTAMIAEAHVRGAAINMGSLLELDAVIEPPQTRAWILRAFRSVPPPVPRPRPIDAW